MLTVVQTFEYYAWQILIMDEPSNPSVSYLCIIINIFTLNTFILQIIWEKCIIIKSNILKDPGWASASLADGRSYCAYSEPAECPYHQKLGHASRS